MELAHLGALVLLYVRSLETQHGMAGHPLGLNFTQNHRLQSITLRLKEVMASLKTMLIAIPGEGSEYTPLPLAPSQEKKSF